MHVVAVPVGLEVAAADLDAQRDRHAGGDHARDHVVVLGREHDGRHRVRPGIAAQHEHRAVLAGVRAGAATPAPDSRSACVIRRVSSWLRRVAGIGGAPIVTFPVAVLGCARSARTNSVCIGWREDDRALEPGLELLDLGAGLVAEEQRRALDARPSVGADQPSG